LNILNALIMESMGLSNEVQFVLNNIPSHLILIEQNGSFVFANNNFLKITGQCAKNFAPCKIDEATFLPQSQKKFFLEAIQQCKTTQRTLDNFIIKFCTTQSSQTVSACGSLAQHDNLGTVCTFQLLSEKFFPSDAVTILEKDVSQNQFIIHISPANLSFEEKELQLKLQDACDLIGLNQQQEESFEFTTFGKSLSFTCRCVGKSSSGGGLYSISCTDITENQKMATLLKSATEQLQELELQLKLLTKFFEVAPTHMGLLEVLEKERDIAIVYSNPAASKALGRTPEQCKGLTSRTVGVSQEQVDESIEFCKIAKQTGTPYSYERHYTRTDLPPITLTTYLIHVEDNKFAFLSQDVSQYHRLQEQLQKHQQELEKTVTARTQQLAEAVQVKSRFLANMSHEIRTPLSGILGMISLLGESPLTSEQEALLHTAEICSEQLLAVINDVLDLTRMEENKLNLEQKLFSLPTLLEDSLEVVAFEAHKKNLDLISDLDPSLPDWTIGDPTRVRQILVNLLGNAVKFSFMGEIVLSARLQSSGEDGYEILCSVQDQGIGIPESSKKAIFQPFSQADSSVTRKFGGSGLGLNIAKHLVHLMGGDIGFESKEGTGSTFFFVIKMKKATDQDFALNAEVADFVRASRPREVEIRRMSLDYHTPFDGNLKALIADTSSRFCESMKKTLTAWNITTDTATSAEEVLKFLPQSSEYSVILLDSRFGMEVTQAFAANKSPKCYFAMVASQATLSTSGLTLKRPVRRSQIRRALVELTSNETLGGGSLPRKRSLEDTALPPVSILIAEDNIANQFTLKKMLESFGAMNVFIVDNGKKAIEALKATPFDIVLMDVMMPEMGGLETTELIRKQFGADRQPYIIAQSANAFSEDLTKCMAAGMNDYITKPINRKSLLSALHKAASSKKQKTS